MANAEEIEASEEVKAEKKSKLPLVVGLFLAIIGSGAGFYAANSGMILAPPATAADHEEEAHVPDALPDIAFVAIDPIIISLGNRGHGAHLRFVAHLEVGKQYEQEVTLLMPRILDVMNSYLRAVSMDELADPSALLRLRGQILRRAQIVTGEGRVRDLLISEFVLN